MGENIFSDNSHINIGFDIKDLKITYASTTGTALIDSFNKINLQNVHFDNNSTSVTCFPWSPNTLTFSKICFACSSVGFTPYSSNIAFIP